MECKHCGTEIDIAKEVTVEENEILGLDIQFECPRCASFYSTWVSLDNLIMEE